MEEGATVRRYEAVEWLESVVGPLGIPTEPTETDFLSCLRNGIILCKVINKVQPGIISKVVENHVAVESESTSKDSRPLSAYQYFENVRNFLVAVQELKLPAFEASDLQRESFQAGSAARIADCILALKSYHQWKESSGGNGVYKHATVKSSLFLRSASENFSRTSNTSSLQPRRQPDVLPAGTKQAPVMHFSLDFVESLVKTLSGNILDSKENLNGNFLSSLQKGSEDPVQIFSEILLRCLEEKQKSRFSQLNLQETSVKAGESHPQSVSVLQESLSFKSNSECSETQARKRSIDHWRMLHNQEKGLKEIKALWSETKSEFEDLQKQLMNDLNHLGSLVGEMSNRARGYQKVIQENRKLYNMVQDLKGNVRVCCRIRPMLDSEAKNVLSFQEDGTLAVLDPITLQGEGREEYQFTRVYGPMATQDELFEDAQPLIRSVMDGYNACIFAYGHTRSGKSYTMYGPPGVSGKEMGINFLALNDLFQTVNARKYTIHYELHVQMVEICNEQVRDLLAGDSTQEDESSLSNVTSHSVKTNDEAIDLVKQGAVRFTGHDSSETTTSSNSSHSVLTVHVQGKDLSGKIFTSRLHLVDLAGSGGEDKSLSCLEDVITSLSRKKSCKHHGDSKLTSLLEDALGGKAKILVFAHVIPEGDSYTKTVSTVKFAQRISTNDLGAASSNKTSDEVTELRKEIESLKSALGDKIACGSQQPCDNERVLPQRNPVKSRRLSLESQDKGTKESQQPCDKERVLPQRNPVKSRRLSLESQDKDTKESQQPCDKERVLPQRNPVKSRRLSLESRDKGTKAPPLTSLRVRRLSLECPKENTLTDYPAPEITKSTNDKGSQIKRSFQAIGKLVSGSEKRNQHKQETSSTKSKDVAASGVDSPTSTKAKVSRRHSLTSLPPSGTPRRTSLGGTSTDSANGEKRWM
ncbi:hypothetical protein vseg_012446 [Gypsophila vaccaria]